MLVAVASTGSPGFQSPRSSGPQCNSILIRALYSQRTSFSPLVPRVLNVTVGHHRRVGHHRSFSPLVPRVLNVTALEGFEVLEPFSRFQSPRSSGPQCNTLADPCTAFAAAGFSPLVPRVLNVTTSIGTTKLSNTKALHAFTALSIPHFFRGLHFCQKTRSILENPFFRLYCFSATPNT